MRCRLAVRPVSASGAAVVDPWRDGLAGAEAAGVRELFARVRAADRRGPDGVPGPGVQVRTARSGDRVVGLAWRAGADPAELVVDPEHRGLGLGAALADGLWDGGIWAHGTLPAAVAMARSAGAIPSRTMLQLRRDLAGPFAPELPAGVRLRTFAPGQDDAAFLAVNGRAFAWHPEQGRLDAAGLRAQMGEAWFDPAGFFLAVTDRAVTDRAVTDRAVTDRAVPGDPVADRPAGDGLAAVPGTGETLLGFHWTKVHPVDPTPPGPAAGPVGEVYVLGVDPASPVRRLGTPLTVAGLAYLAGRGLRSVMLYVESDNDPALKLYRRLGFDDYAVDTVFTRAR